MSEEPSGSAEIMEIGLTTQLSQADMENMTVSVEVEVHPCDYCEGSESPSLSFSLGTEENENLYFSVCGKCFKQALDFIFMDKKTNMQYLKSIGYGIADFAADTDMYNKVKKEPKIIDPDDIYKGLKELIDK